MCFIWRACYFQCVYPRGVCLRCFSVVFHVFQVNVVRSVPFDLKLAVKSGQFTGMDVVAKMMLRGQENALRLRISCSFSFIRVWFCLWCGCGGVGGYIDVC